MIYRLIIIFIFGISIHANAQNSNQFSDKVQMKKFIKEYLKAAKYNIDNEFYDIGIKKVVEKYVIKYCVDTNTNDTIFILETSSLETGVFWGSLWSQQKRIDFLIPYKKRLKFLDHNVFEKEEIDALLEWDKNVFNSFNENLKSISPDSYYATRIIIGNGNISVERIEYLY